MKPNWLIGLVLLAGAARGDVAMRVDPRIELLTVVQLLAGSPRLNLFQQAYRSNVETYFRAHRDHAAVRLSTELATSGFDFDAPPTLMMHLTDPPELAVRVPYTQYLLQRGGGRERLDAFVSALRDFSRVSRFGEFYDANRGMFTAIENATRSQLDGIDYTGKLEQYHGQKEDSYTIVLGLLLHSGGYGPAVNNEIYSLIGPTAVTNGLADFGTLGRLRDLMWHEFGHSFTNPLVEANAAYVSRFSSLFDLIEPEMRSQAYSNWQTSVIEHLVRAQHVRLTCQELGNAMCEAHQIYEKGRGFAYLDAFVNKLKEYEANREQYPTLREFGQRLFEGLESEQAKLNGLLSDTRGRIVIQAPRSTVKHRLYVLAVSNGGALVRESTEESVYGALNGPEIGAFRYESRDGETVVTVEPNNVQTRQVLVALKYAAESDPELKGSFNQFGMNITSGPGGRIRATYIREGSRAEVMGFRIADVLLDWATVARFPLTASEVQKLNTLPSGASATIRVIRNGEEVEMQTGSR